MDNRNIFYVYEHWRTDKDLCFYVGKGKGRRAYNTKKQRNRHYIFLVNKLLLSGNAIEIRIVKSGLPEKEAFDLEIERIKFWKDSGVKLTNVSSGGLGSTGFRHTEEHKERVSKRHKGNKYNLGKKKTEAQKAKISEWMKGRKQTLGTKRTEEANRKTSETLKGREFSEEHKKKISEAKKGKKLSEQHKKELSRVRTGKKQKKETVEKRNEKNRGQKRTAEQIENIKLGKKLAKERRRSLCQQC